MIVRGAPGPVRVLVLDGEARAALATTRALAARGDEVHVASAGGRSLAGASRWARSEHAVGDASSEPEAWAEKVRTLGRSLEAEVWLPITEVSLGSAYQTGLDGEEQMACPNRGTYEAIVDKHALLERAARLGVHVPRSRLIESPEELDGLPAGFRYPAILKPAVGSWGRLLSKVNDREAAEAILEHKEILGTYHHSIFYIQEFITKPGRDIRAFVVGTETVAAIYRTAGHWITNTSRGGIASNCPITPQMDDLCVRAAGAVGGGMVAVDLLEDPDRGLLVNEVNYTMEFRNSIEPTGVNIPARMIDHLCSVAREGRPLS